MGSEATGRRFEFSLLRPLEVSSASDGAALGYAAP
jgi:hypothetical protein